MTTKIAIDLLARCAGYDLLTLIAGALVGGVFGMLFMALMCAASKGDMR